ncbi:hypothetical protein CGRA01v4_08204 [Colletotrichum graminicola]|nr:hypothetical protein CGRA01v4_08204 [Colletotrichum graminicola]
MLAPAAVGQVCLSYELGVRFRIALQQNTLSTSHDTTVPRHRQGGSRASYSSFIETQLNPHFPASSLTSLQGT